MEKRYGHSDYRIRLNAEVDLDIPKGAESLEVYQATVGHKANHTFDPNLEWILVQHPRYLLNFYFLFLIFSKNMGFEF